MPHYKVEIYSAAERAHEAKHGLDHWVWEVDAPSMEHAISDALANRRASRGAGIPARAEIKAEITGP